jgi:hypothetical protein
MTSQALRTLALLRQAIFGPRDFWAIDHRDVKHEDYSFDPVGGSN